MDVIYNVNIENKIQKLENSFNTKVPTESILKMEN